MLQEDKELLLKDLSARLLYGVYVQTKASDEITTEGILWDVGYDETESFIFCKGSSLGYSIDDDIIKPYLRPMSSMTEEERKDLLVTIVGNEGVKYFQVLSDGSIDNTDAAHQDLHNFTMHWINFDKDTVTLYLDWLNRHHFDYRGLIPKGLAIEVTEKNNPYKE